MIRSSHENDLDIIVDYKLKMFKDAGLEELLRVNSRDIIRSTYERLYLEDKATHFIIEKENKILAISGAFIKDDIPYCFYRTPQYGFIGDMYTLPNYRKKGYASRLLGEAMGWLKGKGIREVKLLSSEQGRRIYEDYGFRSDLSQMKIDIDNW